MSSTKMYHYMTSLSISASSEVATKIPNQKLKTVDHCGDLGPTPVASTFLTAHRAPYIPRSARCRTADSFYFYLFIISSSKQRH